MATGAVLPVCAVRASAAGGAARMVVPVPSGVAGAASPSGRPVGPGVVPGPTVSACVGEPKLTRQRPSQADWVADAASSGRAT
jgi:hypothetical protein